MNAIDLVGVTAHYPDATPGLLDVSLRIPAGQRVAIVGASGSGKTTLARALFHLIAGVTGSLSVLDQDPRRLPIGALAPRAQLVFQHPRAMLHPRVSLHRMLSESARRHNSPLSVQAVLASVGLAHRAHALPRDLSGGEQRRAGIARVLMAQPELLVADEPTTGLDAAIKGDIAALVFAPGRTTVLITHDIGLAADHTERLIVMDRGRIIDDAPSLLGLRHPIATQLVAASGIHP